MSLDDDGDIPRHIVATCIANHSTAYANGHVTVAALLSQGMLLLRLQNCNSNSTLSGPDLLPRAVLTCQTSSCRWPR
jgi:hypothetical protein